MSPSIWTQCAGASRIRALKLTAWRAVEAQHQVSTRKLVDSLEEQQLLESLIDAVKPPAPHGARFHYLLSTPFRYPPLRHGSPHRCLPTRLRVERGPSSYRAPRGR